MSRSPNNVLREFLKDAGIFGKDSYDKFIPDIIFALSNEQISMFLSRLYSTDGWACIGSQNRVNLNTNKVYANNVEIGYSSVSRRLCEDIQSLLLRFGIVSNVNQTKSSWTHNGIKKTGVTSYVTISDSDSAIIFADKIGIYGKEDRVNKVKIE